MTNQCLAEATFAGGSVKANVVELRGKDVEFEIPVRGQKLSCQ